MKGLLQLIWKYKIFFLFLFLEIGAFSIIYRQSFYHHSKIFHSANATSGFFLNAYNSTTDYFKLNKINNLLLEENANLISYKKDAYLIYFDDTIYLDSTETQQRYRYVAAKVIGKTTNKHNNYITIDRGEKHGLKEGSAVIGRNNSVVGKVVRTSANFSVISCVINHKMKISAKLKNNNYVGTVLWDGENPQYCKLIDIPTHLNLNKGDSVVTSGYSFIFPEGINIGTIEKFDIFEGKEFYDITIDLGVDFSSIEYVYVAIDKFKSELDIIKPKEEEMNEQ